MIGIMSRKVKTYYGEKVTVKELLELYHETKEDYFKLRRRIADLQAIHNLCREDRTRLIRSMENLSATINRKV